MERLGFRVEYSSGHTALSAAKTPASWIPDSLCRVFVCSLDEPSCLVSMKLSLHSRARLKVLVSNTRAGPFIKGDV